MKFLCPACERLSEIGAFRLVGGALALRCSRCGVESREEVSAEAAPVAVGAGEPPAVKEGASNVVPLRPGPPASAAQAPASGAPGGSEEEWLQPPEGFCPKCVSPRRPEVQACGQCGLVFAHFQPEGTPPSKWLLASWRELLDAWQQPEAHERFIKDALLHQELAAAGRLYRIRQARAPQDAMAAQGRELLLKVAFTPPPLGSPRGGAVELRIRRLRTAAAVLGGLVALSVLVAMVRRLLAMMP